jgi:hypothetical protein
MQQNDFRGAAINLEQLLLLSTALPAGQLPSSLALHPQLQVLQLYNFGLAGYHTVSDEICGRVTKWPNDVAVLEQ